MICNSNSRIGIGIGFQGFSGMAELELNWSQNSRKELESELNWTNIIRGGIGIGIELNQYFLGWNWNRNWIEHHWSGIGIESESTFAGIAHHWYVPCFRTDVMVSRDGSHTMLISLIVIQQKTDETISRVGNTHHRIWAFVVRLVISV